MAECLTCLKHTSDNDHLIVKSERFRVYHYPAENGHDPARGYLLVESVRHVESFSDLTPTEGAELGTLITSFSKIIEKELGAEHVYVFRIGDLVRHIHFHLVPRYKGTPKEFYGDNIRRYHDGPVVDSGAVPILVSQLQATLKANQV